MGISGLARAAGCWLRAHGENPALGRLRPDSQGPKLAPKSGSLLSRNPGVRDGAGLQMEAGAAGISSCRGRGPSPPPRRPRPRTTEQNESPGRGHNRELGRLFTSASAAVGVGVDCQCGGTHTATRMGRCHCRVRVSAAAVPLAGRGHRSCHCRRTLRSGISSSRAGRCQCHHATGHHLAQSSVSDSSLVLLRCVRADVALPCGQMPLHTFLRRTLCGSFLGPAVLKEISFLL